MAVMAIMVVMAVVAVMATAVETISGSVTSGHGGDAKPTDSRLRFHVDKQGFTLRSATRRNFAPASRAKRSVKLETARTFEYSRNTIRGSHSLCSHNKCSYNVYSYDCSALVNATAVFRCSSPLHLHLLTTSSKQCLTLLCLKRPASSPTFPPLTTPSTFPKTAFKQSTTTSTSSPPP